MEVALCADYMHVSRGVSIRRREHTLAVGSRYRGVSVRTNTLAVVPERTEHCCDLGLYARGPLSLPDRCLALPRRGLHLIGIHR